MPNVHVLFNKIKTSQSIFLMYSNKWWEHWPTKLKWTKSMNLEFKNGTKHL
jgi:hypothetical protein